MKDEDWGEEIGFACSDCRFYEERGDSETSHGVCRRFPPREWWDEVQEAVFPRVASYQYCGEFELPPESRRKWQDEVRRRVAGRK